MSDNVIQSSFASGELSPNLYAHVDLAKYHTGLALCRNFFVDYRGGVSTRAGLEFVGQCFDSTNNVRLIDFQFSTIQTYILEFGHQYMRVIVDGAYVLETPKTIVSVTQANPGVFNVAGHGYVTGQWVFLSIAGMIEINGFTGTVEVIDANHFSVRSTLTGLALDTTNFTAFTSGTVGAVYIISTPYQSQDLFDLKYTQSADVMTIAHPNYQESDLTRTADNAWTLTPITIGSAQPAPTLLAGTASSAGTTDYKYVVTAVNASGDESVASNIADIPNAVDISSAAGSISLTWTAAAGAVFYNVYKAQPVTGNTIPSGVNFGFIASVTGVAYVDGNVIPEFETTPPINTNPFAGSNFPGAVAYFQQRRVFAASTDFPETFWASQPGLYHNFDVTNPVADDNAVTGTLVSRQVNAIKHMISMPGGLIMLTSGGAWQLSGGSADAPLTPRSATATPQAYNGCSDVAPIVINYDIIYNQARGSVVRDLSYSFYTNIYTGTDISVMSNHLLLNRSVVSWAYAEDPFKVIWAVTSDGNLLSLTYLKEQEVNGWARSDTQGTFKCVSVIPEGNESSTYFVVERLVAGTFVKYVERMHSRQFPYGSEDSFSVDAGLENDFTFPNDTLIPGGVTGTISFVANSGLFSISDVDRVIRVGGGIADITQFVNSQTVIGVLRRDITDVYYDGNGDPVPKRAPAGTWSLTTPFTKVYGLWHLIGSTVKMLGDGNVFPDQVVSATDGSVTFNQPITRAIVGLGYTTQMQTLRLDIGQPTIQGKRKKIPAVTMRVHQTRGLKIGSTFDTLTEFKMRNQSQLPSRPIELQTGDQRVIMDPSWNTEGQICIEQDYPLPATVLGVIPEIVVGDT